MADIQFLITMTGCTEEEAKETYARFNGNLVDASEFLFQKPVVSGEKYIPSAPSIDTGLSDEQRERCERGRWLQNKVNAVFSVAHSKIQPALLAEKSAEKEPETRQPVQEEQIQLPLSSSSSQDYSEKSPLQSSQSE
jgi:hypothetical protein